MERKKQFMGKIALVIGANGLIGSSLVDQLILDSNVDRIVVFVRKPFSISHPKLHVEIVDLMNPSIFQDKVKGDYLFCCIGTTIKVAGSQAAFEKVDLEIPVSFAKIAHRNAVHHFLLVSSLGANKESSNFYLKTKGRCEAEIAKVGFDTFSIFQPSMLLGKREEFRLGEIIGKVFMIGLGFLFIGPSRKYKAIEGANVAKAMIRMALKDSVGNFCYESDVIQKIADSE